MELRKWNFNEKKFVIFRLVRSRLRCLERKIRKKNIDILLNLLLAHFMVHTIFIILSEWTHPMLKTNRSIQASTFNCVNYHCIFLLFSDYNHNESHRWNIIILNWSDWTCAYRILNITHTANMNVYNTF